MYCSILHTVCLYIVEFTYCNSVLAIIRIIIINVHKYFLHFSLDLVIVGGGYRILKNKRSALTHKLEMESLEHFISLLLPFVSDHSLHLIHKTAIILELLLTVKKVLSKFFCLQIFQYKLIGKRSVYKGSSRELILLISYSHLEQSFRDNFYG